MSTSRQLVDRVVSETIAPRLKALHYRRSGTTWSKPVGDVVRVVQVQRRRGNTEQESRFTLNLGVHHPAFYVARTGHQLEGRVMESNCGLRARIGRFVDGSDVWYTVRTDANVPDIGNELAEVLDGHALPWLEAFETLDDLRRAFLADERPFDAAVAAFVLGLGTVPDLIELAIQTAPHENYARFVQRWATDHHILT